MTLREILLLLAVAVLFAGAIALGSGRPFSEVWWAGVPIVAGVVLGLALRRAIDHSTARRLAHGVAAGGAQAIEVSFYNASGSGQVGTLSARCASDVGWFNLRPTTGHPGLRLLKWLGLSHRLPVEDPSFEAEVYVERSPGIGATLFATRERREAALALFRLGFFAIDYRNSLVVARRRGKVPPDIAAAAEPHMRTLAAA